MLGYKNSGPIKTPSFSRFPNTTPRLLSRVNSFGFRGDVVQLVCENPDGAIFLGLEDDHSPRFAIDIGESLERWQNVSPHRFEPVRSVAAYTCRLPDLDRRASALYSQMDSRPSVLLAVWIG